MTKPGKVACRNPKETRAQNRKPGLTKHTTVDVLARRIASGALGGEGGADLSVYDGFLRGGEADAR